MAASFTRLRIAGFKSFAEPVSFEILPGLTGIVGPNGCGKSNVVEALRWAMGENSARAMRGGEMDDVIFAGTAHRASRNLAEVTLTLEDVQDCAPAPFAASPELQVCRRIERGAGSAYRVNGRDTRARDVQTLFADLASGARSSSMISQGRVAMLVDAKPDERRAILEEAAGITGLHARRHEAELRLRAAEANLLRADDLKGQLAGQLDGLRRQARQAARYRAMSGLVRSAEAEWLGLLHARAETAVQAARQELDQAQILAGQAEAAVSDAHAALAAAEAALPDPRQAEAAARSTLERRRVEAEGHDQEEARAHAQLAAAEQRRDQLRHDLTHAEAAQRDAALAETRLQTELDETAEARRTLPDRIATALAAQTAAAADLQQAAALAQEASETAAETQARAARMQVELHHMADRAGRIAAQRAELDAEIATFSAQRPTASQLQDAETALAAAERRAADDQATEAATDAARTSQAEALQVARQSLGAAEAAHQAWSTDHTRLAGHAAGLGSDQRRLETAWREAESGQVDPEQMVTARFATDSAESALLDSSRGIEAAEGAQIAAGLEMISARETLTEAQARDRQWRERMADAESRRQGLAGAVATIERDYESCVATQISDAALQAVRTDLDTARAALQTAMRLEGDCEAARHEAAAQTLALRQDAAADRAVRERAEADRGQAAERCARLRAQCDTLAAERERAEQACPSGAILAEADRHVAGLHTALAESRAAAEAAETHRTATTDHLATAASRLVAAEAAQARLVAEIDGLAETLRHDPATATGTPIVDQVRVPAGLEAAFGSALGEALESARDPHAARQWRLLPPIEVVRFPGGAESISTLVEAPPELDRALSRIGVLPDGEDGAAWHAALLPGQTLVTRQGAAWRWDGHVISAEAGSGAAARLQLRNRLQAAEHRRPQTEAALTEAMAAQAAALVAAEAARTQTVVTADRRQRADAAWQAGHAEHARLLADAALAEQALAGVVAAVERLSASLEADQADLAQAATRIAALPAPQQIETALGEADSRQMAAQRAEAAARTARQVAETTLQAARDAEAQLAGQAAEAESRRLTILPQRDRLRDELAGATAALQGLRLQDDAQPDLAGLHDALTAAQAAHAAAQAAEMAVRTARRDAETAVSAARDHGAALGARQAEAESRLAAIGPHLQRLTRDCDDAIARLADSEAMRAGLPDLVTLRDAAKAADDAATTSARHHEAARIARDAAQATLTTAQTHDARLRQQAGELDRRLADLRPRRDRLAEELSDARTAERDSRTACDALPDLDRLRDAVETSRTALAAAQAEDATTRAAVAELAGAETRLADRAAAIATDLQGWTDRRAAADDRRAGLETRMQDAAAECAAQAALPAGTAERRREVHDRLQDAETAHAAAAARLYAAEQAARMTAEDRRGAEIGHAAAREAALRIEAGLDQAQAALDAVRARVAERLGGNAALPAPAELSDAAEDRARRKLDRLSRERDEMGPVNLRAELESEALDARIAAIDRERDELGTAIAKLRGSIGHLNREGRERLGAVFAEVDRHFQSLFARMFGGGRAHLALVGSDDPLLAGLEIYAQPPGKKLATLSLLSGGEQALTALSLIFATFRCNPAPICVLDEVDAPLDDANVDRFCALLQDMMRETATRFLVVTHHQLTMARMDRLYGVTMQERGVSRLLSVDLSQAIGMVEPARVVAA